MANDEPPRVDAPGIARGERPDAKALPGPWALDPRQRADYARLFRSEARSLAVHLILGFGAWPEEAWDATQNTFVKVWENWGKFPSDVKARRAWLRTTAGREYLRSVRQDRKHRSNEPVPDLPARDLSPEDVVLLEKATAYSRSVLSTLPTTQRLHLTWHLDGYTNADIARYTGKTEAAVRQNISRALRTLNAQLKGGAR